MYKFTEPLQHQAHHVVRSNMDIYQRAMDEFGYDIDRASNGAFLAVDDASRVAGLSDNMPLHNSSHGNYDTAVRNEINRLRGVYGPLENLTTSQLRNLVDDIEDAAHAVLNNSGTGNLR